MKDLDHARLLGLGRELLEALGYDPEAPEIADTPRRWAGWWREFLDYDPGTIDRTFESVNTDQMVVVSGVRVWSLCEHHLLPFVCDLTMGYIPRGRVLGLSKFARIAHNHAHRLQLQERLTQGIADEIAQVTGSPDVAVSGSGVHLCMVMRGVKTPGVMSSSALKGRFFDNPTVRSEFYRLAQSGRVEL